MGVKYGNDYPYADRSLAGTFIVDDGQLVYVEHVDMDDGTARGFCFHPKTRARTQWRRNINDLDLRPFRLGYVNHAGRAWYVTRTPARQWRQGHVRRNLYYMEDHNLRSLNNTGVNIGEDTVNFVSGAYPNLQAVAAMIEHNVISSVAISRHHALFRRPDGIRLDVHRRGQRVGSVDSEFGDLRLRQYCDCFEDEIKEVLK